MKLLSIVVPVYNEESNLSIFYDRLNKSLESIGYGYEVIFVDDGSGDDSITVMKDLRDQDSRVRIISFSRNFGHQIALTAGIDKASGDAVIVMDADLQHPPEIIKDLISRWEDGYDVVYTIRKDTEGAGLFKKATSAFFYKVLSKISRIDVSPGIADFRLMDKKVIRSFRTIRERSRFIRGLVKWVGFKQIGVEYVAPARYSGNSKYSIRKMMRLAVDGITSFSWFPLQVATYFGLLVSFFSFAYTLYAIFIRLFTSKAVPGWSSLLIAVTFIGGVQLVFLGIIGEYIGRIFEEVKGRPIYIVNEAIGFAENVLNKVEA
ncbi:MAG: glycosyltransferase family 2 protein [Candidatus Omnitrophota bacterium]